MNRDEIVTYYFFNLITSNMLICSIQYDISDDIRTGSISKYLIKPITIFLLITSSATNYMMYKMGIRIDTSMIRNVFETNTREALDLITFSSFLWVFITGIIPSIIVYKTKIYFVEKSCFIYKVVVEHHFYSN